MYILLSKFYTSSLSQPGLVNCPRLSSPVSETSFSWFLYYLLFKGIDSFCQQRSHVPGWFTLIQLTCASPRKVLMFSFSPLETPKVSIFVRWRFFVLSLKSSCFNQQSYVNSLQKFQDPTFFLQTWILRCGFDS